MSMHMDKHVWHKHRALHRGIAALSQGSQLCSRPMSGSSCPAFRGGGAAVLVPDPGC